MAPVGNVLITGCSTGIGRATALYLDQLGFRVFASVRRKFDAEGLRAEASERLMPVLMDVTDAESICRARDEVCRLTGEAGLLGLVNNAGVGFLSPLESVPLESIRRLFEVNFFGVVAVTQAFLPLVRQARGRIINISSEASLVVIPFHGPYSSAKLALNGFSHALRKELKPLGVQVSVIIVGSIDTPIWKTAWVLTEQLEARRSLEIEGLYGKAYRVVNDYMIETGRRGVAPQTAARTILKALTAKRAKHTYLVAVDPLARLFSIVKTIIPEGLQDSLILRGIGLKSNGAAPGI